MHADSNPLIFLRSFEGRFGEFYSSRYFQCQTLDDSSIGRLKKDDIIGIPKVGI